MKKQNERNKQQQPKKQLPPSPYGQKQLDGAYGNPTFLKDDWGMASVHLLQCTEGIQHTLDTWEAQKTKEACWTSMKV